MIGLVERKADSWRTEPIETAALSIELRISLLSNFSDSSKFTVVSPRGCVNSFLIVDLASTGHVGKNFM